MEYFWLKLFLVLKLADIGTVPVDYRLSVGSRVSFIKFKTRNNFDLAKIVPCFKVGGYRHRGRVARVYRFGRESRLTDLKQGTILIWLKLFLVLKLADIGTVPVDYRLSVGSRVSFIKFKTRNNFDLAKIVPCFKVGGYRHRGRVARVYRFGRQGRLTDLKQGTILIGSLWNTSG
jgi:uncharacterized membrane protein